jgi:hypothetical protein
MTVPEMIQVMGVATLLLLVAGVGFTGLRWFWRRTDRSVGAGEVADLQARVAELEAERGHVAELEERLDFAERLLAQERKREQLGNGS